MEDYDDELEFIGLKQLSSSKQRKTKDTMISYNSYLLFILYLQSIEFLQGPGAMKKSRKGSLIF